MPEVFKLRNGITCACDQRPGTGVVAFKIAFKGSALQEEPDEHGLTTLVLDSCFGGTTGLSRQELAHALDNACTDSGASVDHESCEIAAIADDNQAESLFAILSEILIHPTLDPAEIEKAKEMVALNISQGDEDPAHHAFKSFLATGFADQAAGRDPMGDADLIDSFTPAQVRQRHQELLAATHDIVITAAGDITPEKLQELAEKFFGSLAEGKNNRLPTDTTFVSGDYREDVEGKNVHVFLGFEGVGPNDPLRYVHGVLVEHLSGRMSSPLFQEVREKKGLAYKIKAARGALGNTGTFYIQATTENHKSARLAQTVFEVLSGIAKNGIDPAELEISKDKLCRTNDQKLESLETACAYIASGLLEHGRIAPLEEVRRNIMSVTAEQVQQACARILHSQNFVSCAVGPVSDWPSREEILQMKQAAVIGIDAPAAIEFQTVPEMAEEKTAAKTLSEEKIHETILPNGIKILTIERSGTICAANFIATGSNSEPLDKRGLKHALEHMGFKRTASFGLDEIIATLEGRLGAQTNALTSNEIVAYYADMLTQQSLPTALKGIGEIGLKAEYVESDFTGNETSEGERGAILTELAEGNDDPEERTHDLMLRTIYGDQPQGHPIGGSQETVKTITIGDIEKHQKEFHVPNDAIFVTVGPVDHDEIVRLIEKEFGDLQKAPVEKPNSPVFLARCGIEEMENLDSTRFALAFESVGLNHPQAPAFDALSVFLGNGPASRLQQRLVDDPQTPVVSSIEAASDSYTNYGQFVVGGIADTENIRSSMLVVAEEIRNVARNLKDEDIARVKAQLKSMVKIANISNSDRLMEAGMGYAWRERFIPSEETLQKIDETVTRENIVAAAQSLEKYAVSYLVPTGADPTLLPNLDEITRLLGPARAESAPQPSHGR